jgi:hypothetical protein
MIKIGKKIILGNVWDEIILPVALDAIIIISAFIIVECLNK